VYRILRDGAFPLSKSVAANLFAAILTDTGGFQYGNTTAECLRVAADLMERGGAQLLQRPGLAFGTEILQHLERLAAAERALRVVALGRKNYLFCGSDAGGERAAAIRARGQFQPVVRAVEHSAKVQRHDEQAVGHYHSVRHKRATYGHDPGRIGVKPETKIINAVGGRARGIEPSLVNERCALPKGRGIQYVENC